MRDIAVRLKNLDITINKKQILKDINLDIPKGRVVGLLGPSGAGKTTIVRTIVGLQKIAGGNADVLEYKAGEPQLRSQIGYMSQDPDVYTDLTVKENVHYFAQLVRASSQKEDKAIEEVQLQAQTNQLVATLSGGQMVRVSLAVALLGDPKIIVLDEPTVGLDPILRKKLWQDFKDLAKAGKTVIVTSHVMDEAERCDFLVLIREGQILATDSPTNLQKRTNTHSMEQAFLSLIGGEK